MLGEEVVLYGDCRRSVCLMAEQLAQPLATFVSQGSSMERACEARRASVKVDSGCFEAVGHGHHLEVPRLFVEGLYGMVHFFSFVLLFFTIFHKPPSRTAFLVSLRCSNVYDEPRVQAGFKQRQMRRSSAAEALECIKSEPR